MAYCDQCGRQLLEGCHFCSNCGTIVDTSPQAQQQARMRPPDKHSRYAVIGSWSFFGTLLLMCLPVVGLILTLVWALGGAHNLNRVHYARAVLLVLLLSVILSAAAFALLNFSFDAFGRMFFAM